MDGQRRFWDWLTVKLKGSPGETCMAAVSLLDNLTVASLGNPTMEPKLLCRQK